MFRLMVLLCAGIFATMLIGGQDRGQKRFGLMAPPASQEVAVDVTPEPPPVVEAVVEAAFVPEKPLMAAAEAAPAEVVAAVEELAAPPEGRVFYVASASVNVREGPGKDHAVIGRLPQGEAVLVLVEGEGPEGWSFIRIEGDGVEGYVASRLLTE
jgi:hypothetical protein